MMEISIKLLAKEMNVSIKDLIQQCINIGIIKNEHSFITYNEKKTLEKYLKKTSTISKNVLTLKRKTRSTLHVSSSGGKHKYVHVEIRKKQIYSTSDEEVRDNVSRNININVSQSENKISSNMSQKNDNTFHLNKNITKNRGVFSNLKNNFTVNDFRKKENSSSYNSEHKKNLLKPVKLRHNSNSSSAFIEPERKVKNKTDSKITLDLNRSNNNVSNAIHTNYLSSNNKNIKSNYRSSNQKNIRYKKNRNYLDKKANREDIKKTITSDKKNKNYKYSVLKQTFTKPSNTINRDIIISDVITVCELANKMAVKSSEVIKTMIKLGYIVTINQSLDQDIAQLVAEEMGHKVTIYHDNALEKNIMKDRETSSNEFREIRPPIVTIMGHVDHGKTSLLDYIRLTKIASKEAGGITQHIGAYHIDINDKIITFLDTPGHAAFTAMRARGVQVTDIVILVVAADDGVKPQTIEAIQHAQAASVPILVVISKIDKPESEPEKIKNELMKYNIVPEEWGGENIFIHVSAKSGEGIDNLLESILLQAEMLELKASTSGMASGLVIESFLDKGQGPIATILIQEGTLYKGDIVLCGLEYGKIRAIKDSTGKEIQSVKPSIPVKILGLSGIPITGDKIVVVRDEKKAREVSCYRQTKFREKKLAKKTAFKLSKIFENIQKSKVLELNIVLKSDVQGSLEAISDSLEKLSNDSVKIKIIGKGVGSITETDVSLAIASHAMIIGFNVRADFSAKRLIELENIDLRYYSVIYHIIDEVKSAICGMTSPKYKQEVIGLAEVRNIFRSPKFGSITGCMVIEGIVKRNSSIRILRKNKVIYEGELESLRRFKEDINEVRSGVECGIGIKKYNDVRINDIIEVFHTLEIK
ncbi:MAG: translation initiation factor IF-2 [Buchnera aphidicola (Melaphis rhois)]